MHTHICIHIYVLFCMHIHVYTYMYTHMYTHYILHKPKRGIGIINQLS